METAGIASLTAVLFDFGGTLDAEGVPWKERFFGLFRGQGVDVSPEAFAQAFYAADDALTGTIPADLPWRETVVTLAEGVERNLGLQSTSIVDKTSNLFLAEAGKRLGANAALIERLSHRYRVGIISNFYGNLATVCHEVGLAPFLSVIVDSARVGCVKPEPRIFRIALEALRAEPAQAVFVGDSLRRDMAGARQVGMPHVWLKAEGSAEEGPCCPGDPVIRRLAEVRGLLL